MPKFLSSFSGSRCHKCNFQIVFVCMSLGEHLSFFICTYCGEKFCFPTAQAGRKDATVSGKPAGPVERHEHRIH
jgi:hypothetical protein